MTKKAITEKFPECIVVLDGFSLEGLK